MNCYMVAEDGVVCGGISSFPGQHCANSVWYFRLLSHHGLMAMVNQLLSQCPERTICSAKEPPVFD